MKYLLRIKTISNNADLHSDNRANALYHNTNNYKYQIILVEIPCNYRRLTDTFAEFLQLRTPAIQFWSTSLFHQDHIIYKYTRSNVSSFRNCLEHHHPPHHRLWIYGQYPNNYETIDDFYIVLGWPLVAGLFRCSLYLHQSPYIKNDIKYDQL